MLVHTDMAGPHLHHAGSPAQKARWMPGITSGRTITAVAITEPGAGSDVAGLRTRARREDDAWVIDGSKIFITNGVHADLYFVAARTGEGRHDISIFAVEKGTPGLRVGRQLDKTGLARQRHRRAVFRELRVPAGHLLGEQGKGFHAVMKNFQTERIALGAMALATCQQALDLTLDHVMNRQAFGAPLWNKQTVRQKFAMLDARTRAARQYLYHCAWRVTQGHDIVQDVTMLKALTGELVNEVTYGLPTTAWRHGLHDRHTHRAPVARRPRAGHRRRGHRGDAGRSGQAILKPRHHTASPPRSRSRPRPCPRPPLSSSDPWPPAIRSPCSPTCCTEPTRRWPHAA